MPRSWIACLLLLQIAAAPAAGNSHSEEEDTFAAFNHPMFTFNDTLDVYALEPVARGWDKVMPERVQTTIVNFFQNLRTPYDMANNILQGSPHQATVDLSRFITNTVFGLGGIFDPATDWGLIADEEDFGQTLGVWGVPAGPYLVLPLLGPSNPRDLIGYNVDAMSTAHTWFVPFLYTTAAAGVRMVNTRSLYLDEVENLKEASVDYYAAVRNAYKQRREAQIEDRHGASTDANQDLYKIDDEE